tara:strand:+ start:202 stop:555 length:354 start_codon:yes stop_codon:yes gene_type:complete
MNWNCQKELDKLVSDFNASLTDHLDMKYIQALSKLSNQSESDKKLTTEILKTYFKRSGFVENYLLGRTIYVSGFVCAEIKENCVELWHDTKNKIGSVFINNSLLTGLPISINYMNRL